ncbi:hypothetical protein [Paraburkholderia kururiensis]|uniref:hypothetical protein n=1 Tax=Paraburkholderia kururiensis TaxID=984307 RepID=UPI000F872054|nr:hypothetical protein [Paraburkholderia kururiensis]
MKLHTRHIRYLIRAIVVLIVCNLVALVCDKWASEGAVLVASIGIAFVAQLLLVEPIFEAYMRWNTRRLMHDQ